MESFNEKEIKRTLKTDARAIGIPSGSAKIFIEKTLESTKKQLKNKSIITDKDLERIIAKELKKYNSDLAYIYRNRDKII